VDYGKILRKDCDLAQAGNKVKGKISFSGKGDGQTKQQTFF
jgi:hypothetical protein